MTEDYTYNGWSNRETWLAGLWLTNDEVAYDLLNRAVKHGESDFVRADWLEQQLRKQLYERSFEASLWSDLLLTAFNRINWIEVIEQNR